MLDWPANSLGRWQLSWRIVVGSHTLSRPPHKLKLEYFTNLNCWNIFRPISLKAHEKMLPQNNLDPTSPITKINLNQTSSFPSSEPPQWIAIPSNTEDRQAQRAPNFQTSWRRRAADGKFKLSHNPAVDVARSFSEPGGTTLGNQPTSGGVVVWVGGTHAVQKAGGRDSKTQTMVNIGNAGEVYCGTFCSDSVWW